LYVPDLRRFALSFIVCAVSLLSVASSPDAEYSTAAPSGGLPGISPGIQPFEREAWLRLAFVGLPAGRAALALGKWSTPEALLKAAQDGRDDELLSTPGLTPVSVERIREAATRDIWKALTAMQEYSIRLLLQSDDDYPRALHSIPDPPLCLFARGTIEERDEIAVAIVGTRHATEYGRGLAHKLAHDLARRDGRQRSSVQH
jgi:predicted Rossmann fold nucleotide-binding protein DprA/Smf involved in DNA uptake